MLTVVSVMALILALLAWRAWWNASAERRLRPWALRRAVLVYMEKTFRTQHPAPFVAKVDRVYRRNDGSLVLVELKTREIDRVYLSDIIQLSVQKLAIEMETNQSVESHAFVTIVKGAGRGVARSHRVPLLPAEEIAALERRRRAILMGQALPTYVPSEKACRKCAFGSRCERFRAMS